jgi:hypothetical protein
MKKKRNTGAQGATGISLLDNVLEGAKERGDEEISATPQFKLCKNFFSTVASDVSAATKQYDGSDSVAVELEARFGTVIKTNKGTAFKPELQIADFNKLKNALDLDKSLECYTESTIDYSYDVGSDKTSRIRISTEDEEGLDNDPTIMRKTKVNLIDIAFPQRSHDVRIAVALEIGLQEHSLPQNFDKKKYTGYRKKERTVYESEDVPWKIELTIVETIQCTDKMGWGKPKNTSGDITYEAEIELDDKSELFRDKTYVGSPEFKELVKSFYERIRSLLDILGGDLNMVGGAVLNQGVAPFPEVKEVLVSSDTMVSKLKERVGKCFGESSIQTFPGSMPVTFGRRHTSTVMNNNYMISEKTDGVRYMFLISQEGAFIINRSYNFYKVGFDSLKESFAKENTSTLLDGELVRHHDGRVIFLVFDVVAINGVPYYQEGFAKRYQDIGTYVIAPYRKWKDVAGNSSGLPFDMMQKIFHKKDYIEAFFQKIVTIGKDKYYKDEKRFHKTDGIIITPTTPYALRKAVTLFKWKYAELQSIDFTCVQGEDPGHFHLRCGVDGDNEQECYYTTFPPEDLQRLKADWERHHRNSNRAIIECTYDTRAGIWRYYAMRPDKNVPNFITTMCDTWTGIAENVTENELIRAIKPAKPPQQHQQVQSQQYQNSQNPQRSNNNNNNNHSHYHNNNNNNNNNNIQNNNNYQNNNSNFHNKNNNNNNNNSYHNNYQNDNNNIQNNNNNGYTTPTTSTTTQQGQEHVLQEEICSSTTTTSTTQPQDL